MPQLLTLHSPAKINLFLHVTRKRPDGYHDLASLLQTVSLTDTLSFELIEEADGDRLTCSDPNLPMDRSNLVVKAIALFRRKMKVKKSFKIHLEKQIPYQAGLGGGSGNAATTLWGINQLLDKPATEKDLLDWASEIGSDIPFFFSKGTAFCKGRGEQVWSQPELPAQELWIVKPTVGLSTPAVYGALKLNSQDLIENTESLLQGFYSGHPRYFNDLEKPAFSLMPKLGELKAKLLASGFHTVLLAGSGSSFFCLGPGKPPSEKDLLCLPLHFLNRTRDQWY